MNTPPPVNCLAALSALFLVAFLATPAGAATITFEADRDNTMPGGSLGNTNYGAVENNPLSSPWQRPQQPPSKANS